LSKFYQTDCQNFIKTIIRQGHRPPSRPQRWWVDIGQVQPAQASGCLFPGRRRRTTSGKSYAYVEEAKGGSLQPIIGRLPRPRTISEQWSTGDGGYTGCKRSQTFSKRLSLQANRGGWKGCKRNMTALSTLLTFFARAPRDCATTGWPAHL